MRNKERIEYLLQRYRDNHASGEELEELASRLSAPLEEQAASEWLYSQLQHSAPVEGCDKDRLEAVLEEIRQPQIPENTPKKRLWLRRLWPAAAAVLFLAFIGWYWLFSKKERLPAAKQQIATGQILPGHSGAVLHLSNGKKILLDSLQNGTLVSLENVQVIKKNGTLQYVGAAQKMVYNTVTTNRGRQWQLTLSDGTKVWLNAESSIRYPLSFNGKERIVQITGEAYFEVVHNASHPFKVLVNNQIIEDVGTSFNVNAYKDRGQVMTTLLRGAIRVRLGDRSALLKPGQQAEVGNFIHVNYGVNTETVIAWKNGVFQFDKADLQDIMQQIGRWYNVSVVYKGTLTSRKFSGKIPRDMQLSDVLKILQQAGVHFDIQPGTVNAATAGKIIVSP